MRTATYSENRNKKRKVDEFETEVIKILKSDAKVDEHHYFGLTIAEQMRKLTPEQTSYLRLKINEVIHATLYGEH